MATDISYEQGKEKMQQHMNEVMSAYKPEERQNPETIRYVADGHREALTKAQAEGLGKYANPQYAAGAQDALNSWEREQLREAQRETVKIRVA